MLEQFQDWNPQRESAYLLGNIEGILEKYKRMGYKLTLRQLYYQLVSQDIIDNKVSEYHRLGNIVSRGRLAGLIDWSMIEDRVRRPVYNTHWNSPQHILNRAKDSYYMSKWERQENYIEIWCEKDAVSNILEPICNEYDVLFMANRGYSSQTAMYNGYQRFAEAQDKGKYIHLFYFGDHDPSGIDMVNDIQKRLGLFLYGDIDDRFEQVTRVALTMDQITKYNPPENPAKTTDSRYQKYAEKYGESSWELDALEPDVLSKLAKDSILTYCDMEIFKSVVGIENEHKELMQKVIDNINY